MSFCSMDIALKAQHSDASCPMTMLLGHRFMRGTRAAHRLWPTLPVGAVLAVCLVMLLMMSLLSLIEG